MALVGHISGSSQSSSRIGVTGSVIFANRPAATFPGSMPGSDTVFFVSGSIGGKAAAEAGSVAVFGGDAVISGSLTVGTGSIKITSNDIQFGGAGNRIELNGSDLKFFDATNPSGFTLTSLGSGGGGGVPSYWASITNNEIFTTGSVVASGSILVKNSAGLPVVSLDVVTGNVTGSNLRLTGGELTTAQSTFALLAGATTSITVGGSATAITLGTGLNSSVNIPGSLFVQGSVTAIDSVNTKIKDALLLLGSGSAAIDSAPSAIAFASGSVTPNQALIFGAGIGQDTLAAAKADVQDGGLAISAGTFVNYVPIRAGRFELGGATAFITSSDAKTLTAKGDNVLINAANGNTSFQNDGFAVLDVSGSGVSGASLDIKAGPSTTTANLFSNPGTSVTAVNFGKEAGTLSLGKSGGSSTFNGNVTGSNFSVTGPNITTTQSTFNLVNTTATKVNFAGAATLLTMGASGPGSSTNVVNVLTASDGIVVGAGGSFANIIAGVGMTTANLFNTVATTVNFAGAGTNISVGAGGSGATFLKNAELFVSGTTTFGASVLPSADVTHDLGSPTKRWANMYTGDLHLKNDRGDWTIIEESDFLTITNNKNGKRYKFVLQEIG